jgi:hypothetical protein
VPSAALAFTSVAQRDIGDAIRTTRASIVARKDTLGAASAS